MKNIKGLVFDLDDTLYLQADYKRSGFKAVANWLEDHKNLRSREVYHALNVILEEKGPSHPHIFDLFVDQNSLDPKLVETLVDLFIKHQPQISCFEGIINMFNKLRKNYHLGILTDGRHSTQQKKINALKLSHLCDYILYSDSLELSKPAPDLFLRFEQKFNLCGNQLAYIGDNPNKDFIGAKKLKWKTFRVLTGEYRNLKVTDKWDADITLNKCTDILACLDQTIY